MVDRLASQPAGAVYVSVGPWKLSSRYSIPTTTVVSDWTTEAPRRGAAASALIRARNPGSDSATRASAGASVICCPVAAAIAAVNESKHDSLSDDTDCTQCGVAGVDAPLAAVPA